MESSPGEANSPFRGFSVNILRERLSVCIRVTGAWPRATCVSAAIRPAEFRFQRNLSFADFIDGPRHRCRDQSQDREGKPRNRLNARKQRHSARFPAARSSSQFFHHRSCSKENLRAYDEIENLGSRCARQEKGSGRISFFFLSLFLRERLRGWKREGQRKREKETH